MPPDVVEEVLVIILKITIIVCGSLVAGRLVLAKCGQEVAGVGRIQAGRQ